MRPPRRRRIFLLAPRANASYVRRGGGKKLSRRARNMVLDQNRLAPAEPALLLGDAHPLVEQLGCTEGLVTLGQAGGSLRVDSIRSVPALRTFLQHYREQLLAPVEFPAIGRAWSHASRNEVRELIALDQSLAGEPVLKEFASASQRVGRAQLRRLRPLRDHRVVRRYLQAVDEGRAHGWHTVVYGLSLAVYSLPVRQGLVSYGCQTIRGFVEAAIRPVGLTETGAKELAAEFAGPLPDLCQRTVALLPV